MRSSADRMKAEESRRYMILLQMLLPDVGEINVVKFVSYQADDVAWMS